MKKRKVLVSILCAAAMVGLSTTALTSCRKKPDDSEEKEEQKYSVTFESNGGSAVESITDVVNDSVINEPTAPTKEGFTFGGWYKDIGLTEEFKFGTDKITANTTLYAKWDAVVTVEYTVSFDLDGGTGTAPSQKIKKGEKANKPQDPTKEGSEFKGWFKDNVEFDFANTPITGDVTLKAKWDVTKVKVTFDLDGGSFADGLEEMNVLYNSPVTLTAEPTKVGYDFVGWLVDDAAYDLKTPVTKEIELKANWEIHQYKVTFNEDNGSENKTELVKYNWTVSQPIQDPVKKGYRFDKWVDQEGKAYDFDTPVTADITLKATYVAQLKVTFDLDGGTSEDIKDAFVDGNTVVSKPKVDPFKEGCRFDKWVDEKGNAFDFATPVTSDVTIKATWIEIVKVTYDLDGGKGLETLIVTLDKGSILLAPTADITKENHRFDKWVDENNNDFNFGVAVNANVTVKASWVEVVKVTFDLDGGSGLDVLVRTIDKGTPVAEPIDAVTKKGHDFAGWTLNDETYNFKSPVNSSIIIKATWTVHQYTITWKTENGVEATTTKVAYNNNVTKVNEPKKPGFRFDCWTLNSGEVFDFENTLVTADITLVATYIQQVSVTFDLDGGSSDTIQNTQVDIHKSISRPEADPTKEGYDFVDWYVEDKVYDFTQPVDGNITIKAKWELHLYTITLDVNGHGTLEESQQVVKAAKIPENLPALSSVEGWIFLGWCTDEDGKDPVVVGSKVAKDMTLYAHWTEIVVGSHTITYVTERGTLENNVLENVAQIPTKLPPLSAPAYQFLGWFTDEAKSVPVVPGQVLDGDITLYAKWEPVYYTVNYVTGQDGVTRAPVNDGEAKDTQNITEAMLAPLADISGWRFVGWFTNEAKTTPAEVGELITEEMTLYAKWVKQVTVTFDLDGGTADPAIDAVTGDEKTTFEKPTVVPTKEGYRFDCWVDANDTPFNFETTLVTENTTLTAKWIQVFVVSFDLAGGQVTTPIENQTVDIHCSVTEPSEVPTKKGYRFGGWYKGLEEFNFETSTIKENTVLVAYWFEQVTVSFEMHGGEGIEPIVVDRGEMITTTLSPNYDGYWFKGWYIIENDAQVSFDPTLDPVSGNITLHAQWGDCVAIPQRDTLTAADAFLVAQEQYGATTVPADASWDIYGCIFAAGFIFGEKEISSGGSSQPTEAAKIRTITVTLTEPARLVFVESKLEAGRSFTITGPNGYTQTFTSTGTPKEDVTDLLASGTYVVTFGANCKFTALAIAHEDKIENVVSIETPKEKLEYVQNRDAYEYEGVTILTSKGTQVDLAKYSNLISKKFVNKETQEVVRDITEIGEYTVTVTYGKFTSASYDISVVPFTYLVSFDVAAEGLDPIASQKILPNGSVEEPTAPSRDGYRFDGWYNGDVKFDFEHTQVNSTLKLTAKWVATHVVSFDTGVANTPMEDKTVDDGTMLQALSPLDNVAGYRFDGWYSATRNEAQELVFADKFDFSTKITQDVLIAAKWTQVYNITFETGKKEVTAPNPIINDVIPQTLPSLASISGWKFVGWKVKDTNETPVVGTALSGDIILVADWEEVEVITNPEVTFDLNGAEGVAPEKQTLTAGGKASKPTDPKRAGYRFVGWSISSTDSTHLFDFDTEIHAHTTLYAQFIQQVTVTFEFGNGTTAETKTLDIHSVVAQPEDPTRDGYRFDGWYSATRNEAQELVLADAQYNFELQVEADIIIAAKWVQVFTVKFTVDSDVEVGTEGVGLAAQTVDKDANAKKPTVSLTKDGYRFDGWHLNINDKDEFNFGTPITKDVELVAKWVLVFTVNFIVNGTTVNTQTVDRFGKVTLVENPVVEGYTFLGWYKDDNTLFNPKEDFVTENLNLNARLEETSNTTTLTFMLPDDTIPYATITVQKDALVDNLPADPEKPSKRFVGWYDAATGGNKIDFATAKFTSETTLHAYFEDITYNYEYVKSLGADILYEDLVAGLKEGDILPEGNGSFNQPQGFHGGNNSTGSYGTNYVQYNAGALELVDPASGDTGETHLDFDFGTPYNSGIVEGFMEVTFYNAGNSWTPIQFHGSYTGDDTYSSVDGDEVFAFRTDGGKLKYRLNKSSKTFIDLTEPITYSNSTYGIYFRFDLTKSKVLIIINNVVRLDTTLSTGVYELDGIRFTSANGDSKRLSVKDIAIKYTPAAGVIANDIELCKHSIQSYYNSFNLDDYTQNKSQLDDALANALHAIDTATSTQEAYNASNDGMTIMSAVQTDFEFAKDNAIKELISLYPVDSYTRPENTEEFEQKLQDAKQLILNATNIDAVAGALDEAKTLMNAVKTDATLLNELKETKKTELVGEFNTLDYDSENQTKLATALEEAKAKIDAATFETMDQAYQEAVEHVNAQAKTKKTLKKDELKAHADSEIKRLFTDAGKKLPAYVQTNITDLITEGNAAIDLAGTDDEMNSAYTNYAGKIDTELANASVTATDLIDTYKAQLEKDADDACTTYDITTEKKGNIPTLVSSGKAELDALKTKEGLTNEEVSTAYNANKDKVIAEAKNIYLDREIMKIYDGISNESVQTGTVVTTQKDAILAQTVDASTDVQAIINNFAKFVEDQLALVLTAPVLTMDQTTCEISWVEVDGATSYDVYVDGTLAGNQTELKYNLKPTESKDYAIKVVAKAEGKYDSVASDAIEITATVVAPTDLGKVTFENGEVKYSLDSAQTAVECSNISGGSHKTLDVEYESVSYSGAYATGSGITGTITANQIITVQFKVYNQNSGAKDFQLLLTKNDSTATDKPTEAFLNITGKTSATIPVTLQPGTYTISRGSKGKELRLLSINFSLEGSTTLTPKTTVEPASNSVNLQALAPESNFEKQNNEDKTTE